MEFSSDFVSVFQSPPLHGKACRAKYRIESKIFLFLLFPNACRLDSKSPISTITVFEILRLVWTICTFTKTWSGALSCVFVVSSLSAIVSDGSKSFSFLGCSLIRIVSSTSPGSVSLVHGFTRNKSVLFLFSTRQARYQQQTEILIHLLAPVNDITGVLYLVDPMWIFSSRIWEELQF